jgi:rubrerythrin
MFNGETRNEKARTKTSDQILQVALAKEKEARDFYDEQAAHCRVDFVRKLLENSKMRNPNIFVWCRV